MPATPLLDIDQSRQHIPKEALVKWLSKNVVVVAVLVPYVYLWMRYECAISIIIIYFCCTRRRRRKRASCVHLVSGIQLFMCVYVCVCACMHDSMTAWQLRWSPTSCWSRYRLSLSSYEDCLGDVISTDRVNRIEVDRAYSDVAFSCTTTTTNTTTDQWYVHLVCHLC